MSNISVLKRDGFGEDKLFHCIVAEIKSAGGGTPALTGYLLYFWTYSTAVGRVLWVDDLYVRQAYRRNRTGSALWAHVTKEAVKKGCRRVLWLVQDRNTHAREFYRQLGSVDWSEEEGWLVYRLDSEAMTTMKGTAPDAAVIPDRCSQTIP